MADSTFGSIGTTILFSVMVGAGSLVIISILLMSSKYTSRSRFGIYDPVLTPGIANYSFLQDPMTFERASQPYIAYNGNTYFLQPVRGLARARINKLDVLTEMQLEELFPPKTYLEWNNGGKEDIQNRNKGVIGYKEEFHNEEDHEENENQHKEQTSAETEPSSDTFKVQKVITAGSVEKDIVDMPNIELTDLPPLNERHFDSGICAICLEDLEDSDIVRGLICGHVFHKDCLDPWLTRRKAVCPTCKRDLYIQESMAEAAESSRPGSLELDQILNVGDSNPHVFFLVSCITEFKALTLLAGLESLRLSQYPLETAPEDESEGPIMVDRRLKVYEQPIILQDETPPMPNMKKLNKNIEEILKRDPPVFDVADLQDIDHLAFEKTNYQYKGLLKWYLKWISVNWLNLYYLNVVKIYEKQRKLRQNL